LLDDEDMSAPKVKTERWRKYWDRHSKSYDREMAFFDRRLFGDSRDWVCRQAVGTPWKSLSAPDSTSPTSHPRRS
jgi:hypothetical protein